MLWKMFETKQKIRRLCTRARSNLNFHLFWSSSSDTDWSGAQIWFSRPYSTSWHQNQLSEYKLYFKQFLNFFEIGKKRKMMRPKMKEWKPKWLSPKKRYLRWPQMGAETQNGLKSGLLYGKGGEGEIWQRTKLYFWWEILRNLWNSNSRLGWVMPRKVLHLKWSTMIWFEIPFCNLDPKRINLREHGWRNKVGAVFF